MKKTCCRCNDHKDLSEFWKDKNRKDGLMPICIECKKSEQQKNKDRAREYYQEYYQDPVKKEHALFVAGKYQKTTAAKESRRKSRLKGKPDSPEIIKARSCLNNAIKAGKISREPCSVCGKEKYIHGHHKDYSKPLDVIWLCAKHHKEMHLSQ